MEERFDNFSERASHGVGHPVAFAVAVTIVVAWALMGPFLGFSDTWQLVINTATTISTGLIVFLLQNTQNRETALQHQRDKSLHAKLDEVLRAIPGANDALRGTEPQGES